MQFFTLVLAALLSVTSTGGLESQTPLVYESTAIQPGFTWCYEPSMRGRCVNATTPPGQCSNASRADSNKASSAIANAHSSCTLYNRWNCGLNGETLEILPEVPVNNLSDYGFDNMMGSYRCDWAPQNVTCNILVAGTDGSEYGYLGSALSSLGFYGSFQSHQAGALEVSFEYSPKVLSQLNLRASNGPTANSTFPFVGGMHRRVWHSAVRSVFVDLPGRTITDKMPRRNFALGGTRETPPFDNPRTFSTENSYTGAGWSPDQPKYIESSIWRYDPTSQGLFPQWINPDGGKPQTTIVFIRISLNYGAFLCAVESFEVDNREGEDRLALAGDIDVARKHSHACPQWATNKLVYKFATSPHTSVAKLIQAYSNP
ncbi:hypothetical protein B0H17DRAFT_1153009 [Mycena rosella]|uniref:Uncharacterized protein n=1 Tax=Mycena rosella TaxID=1033263 RepID=A0AAD7B956_MYCRO|nr:hypothetical protein B0H17DRAFT_1153009 [Mycena rosella]